ncbi:hypothetical protein KVT40_009240 [Elsinoe batatas]|uniref:Uncharacterized protein n=1 Tax=Elsinoe batatas TaxID=2601811 RepID=A0A8K0KUL2_9PEZI|nr:hypothetical protein KVT40_009240 [Elsinoe batatas]
MSRRSARLAERLAGRNEGSANHVKAPSNSTAEATGNHPETEAPERPETDTLLPLRLTSSPENGHNVIEAAAEERSESDTLLSVSFEQTITTQSPGKVKAPDLESRYSPTVVASSENHGKALENGKLEAQIVLNTASNDQFKSALVKLKNEDKARTAIHKARTAIHKARTAIHKARTAIHKTRPDIRAAWIRLQFDLICMVSELMSEEMGRALLRKSCETARLTGMESPSDVSTVLHVAARDIAEAILTHYDEWGFFGGASD